MNRRPTDEELRAIYDQSYVDQYDPHAVQRMRRMLPFFDLSKDDAVADFGCGNGVLLELVSPSVREYTGVDFSEEFVRAAERRREELGIRNGTFHCGDIVSFCGEHPNQFDAAFALDFSEHIRRCWLSAASRTSTSDISRTIFMWRHSSMGSAICRSSVASFERDCS
jgi:cyclopropane fatty-acyl-phospholipid synthase-like methyltransferase